MLTSMHVWTCPKSWKKYLKPWHYEKITTTDFNFILYKFQIKNDESSGNADAVKFLTFFRHMRWRTPNDMQPTNSLQLYKQKEKETQNKTGTQCCKTLNIVVDDDNNMINMWLGGEGQMKVTERRDTKQRRVIEKHGRSPRSLPAGSGLKINHEYHIFDHAPKWRAVLSTERYYSLFTLRNGGNFFLERTHYGID